MFMDDLATNRFVMLGGPLGEDGKCPAGGGWKRTRMMIRSTLARDPWSKAGIFELQSIQLWTVLLQAGPVIRAMPSPRENFGSDARAS